MTTTAIIPVDKARVKLALEQLKRVGLDPDDSFGFEAALEDPQNYSGNVFEWTERGHNMRFLVYTNYEQDRITAIHVYSLSEFTGGFWPFSKELIAEVNAELQLIFSPEFLVDEELIARLIPVDVLFVDYGAQVASVRLDDGSSFGINLWELHGRARRDDDFTDWKYRDTGRI